MNWKGCLIACCMLVAMMVATDNVPTRHCDAGRRICYATYMIFNERLDVYMPTVVAPVAAYCSNASNMAFATTLFASLNDSRPSYALGDLLQRDFPGEQLRIGHIEQLRIGHTEPLYADKTYWVHATVTQVCDMDALHCRYTDGYNTPRTIAMPGMTRYTTSAGVAVAVIAPLPPAFFVGRWKGDCPAANDTVSPLGTMPPADCVTYVGSAGAFRLCVPGMAEQLLGGTCVSRGALVFCAVAPPAGMTADTVPENTALGTTIVPGLFFTSHPLLAAVEITAGGGGAAVAAASAVVSFVF